MARNGNLVWAKYLSAIASTLLLTLVFTTDETAAQGILVPERDHEHFVLPRPGIPVPPQRATYQIEKIGIDAAVNGQIVRSTVTQTFKNTGSVTMEASFVFPLPHDAAVDAMTFLVDGREIEAKLMPADKARQVYESYVRRNKDPALLEWVGWGMLKSSVFPIPPGESRTVTLKYSHLLKNENGVVDFLFPLATARYTAQPVKELSIRVALTADQDLKNVYSPTHDVKPEWNGERNAIIRLTQTNVVPANDFRLLWSLDSRDVGASVVSYWPQDEDQGYYLLLASPRVEWKTVQMPSKNIIFVLDRSGSMNGKKIDQAREAAKFVLNNLRPDDLFNIIAYDTDVEAFSQELERYAEETRAKGIGFINSIQSGGSTNIDLALKTAFASITDGSRPTYVVFLTDGLPTAGETNEMAIVANAKAANRYAARMIAFGVGFDVNSRLIDRLTRENRGQSVYVRPDEDIEQAVSQLFSKISMPVMTDVSVHYGFSNVTAEMGAPVRRVYPDGKFDLFAGGQVVVVGRYAASGPCRLKIEGKVGEDTRTFEYDVQFARRGEGERNRYVAALWASRRIGELIDQIDLNGKNEELVDELVQLSKKYGIITPYTSFLADENQQVTELYSRSSNNAMASGDLELLGQSGGQSGFTQRAIKGQFKSAQRVAPAPNTASMGMGFGGGGLDGGGELHSANGIRKNQLATLYKRGELLIADNAADLDLEEIKDQIIEIPLFSEEYFKIVAQNSEDENRLLASQHPGEELVVKLRGKVYRFK